MKKCTRVTLTILFLICVINFAFGQMPKEYFIFIKKADSLYTIKDFKNSGLAFSSAFKTYGGKGLVEDRYKAARSWAMANNADSAFFNLYRITEKVFFNDYDRIIKEDDFKPLYTDSRWAKLLELIKQNKVFNFGFERIDNSEALPYPWFQWGTKDYILRIDSIEKHSGKYSLLIEPTEDIKKRSFGCVAYSIPADYIGKKIEVTAYIKMENVTESIGLMLRIDDKSKSLQFDNMQQKGIKGTKDWTLYSVKLPLPKDAITIYIGAILSGTGKLWVDDFQVLIDGKDISEAILKKK